MEPDRLCEVTDACSHDLQRTGSPMPPSPFAACFDSQEHSDVLLRVYTDIALQPTNAGKEPAGRTVPAPAAAPAVRSYHCHAIILASQSGYFKAQLSQPWQQPQPRAPGAAARHMCWRSPHIPDTQQTVDIHVDAEELDALHELLCMLYSQTLPAAPPGAPAFVQCLKLADRFEAASCMEILIAGLAAASIIGNVKPSILSYVLQGGVTPGVCVSRSYPALLDSCSKALVRLFGDVPSVIKDEALLQQFCALPHAAVLAWVKSDDLQVHSENCVVFLLTAWVKTNQGSTAAQLEELAHQVRVFHLGPAYLHHILPSLAWLKDCSSMQYMPAVVSCIRAGINMGQGLEAEQGKMRSSSSFVLPPGWCAKPRRSSSSPSTSSWVLSPSQLKEISGGKVLVLPSPVSINGLLMSLQVDQRATDSSAPEPGMTMGLFLGVDVAAMDRCGLLLPHRLMVQLGSPRAVVGSSGSEQRRNAFIFKASLYEADKLWGPLSFLGTAAPSFLELVAPYLDAGQLHIEVFFSAVDA